eukprot:1158912-Pelagomonas_calceolata.AAC.11
MLQVPVVHHVHQGQCISAPLAGALAPGVSMRLRRAWKGVQGGWGMSDAGRRWGTWEGRRGYWLGVCEGLCDAGMSVGGGEGEGRETWVQLCSTLLDQGWQWTARERQGAKHGRD